MLNKIDQLTENLPLEWKTKIVSEFILMKNEAPSKIDLKKEKTRFTFGLNLQPELSVRSKIYKELQPLTKRFKGLFLQPVEGLHLSVQWSLVEGDIYKLSRLAEGLTIPNLNATIKYAYPSKPNIFAVVIPSEKKWMEDIRSCFSKMMLDCGLEPALPPNLPLMWMSLIRFTDEFDANSLEEIISLLPDNNLVCKNFRVFLAKSDPFFSEQTRKILFTKEI